MKIQETQFPGSRAFILENSELRVCVIGTGAAVQDIEYAGRHVALGYGNARDYRIHGDCIGGIVGRYANRIGGAGFPLNGQMIVLSANENGNQLHGGNDGLPWHQREWEGHAEKDSVTFTLRSPDGDNGFPGNVTAQVRYSLEGSALRIDFEGNTDRDTVFAPTSHIYFRLGGGTVLDTTLQISAKSHLECGPGLIPTGRILDAEGDFDFSRPKPIGRNFDDCFPVTDTHMLSARQGGIRLELCSDYPAVQLYTGEFLSPPYRANDGFAVEPEFYPDSPNRPEFPTPVLRAGEHFHKYAVYRFSRTAEA